MKASEFEVSVVSGLQAWGGGLRGGDQGLGCLIPESPEAHEPLKCPKVRSADSLKTGFRAREKGNPASFLHRHSEPYHSLHHT